SSQAQGDSTQLVYKGYKIMHGRPVFYYEWPAAKLGVEDHLNPNKQGNGWERTIKLVGASPMLSSVEAVIGNSPDVVEINPGLIALQGSGYYVQWNKTPALILQSGPGKMQVRVPVQGNSFTYQLIW
ncbi:MAG: hypothetical protein ACKOXH_08595, partial [Aquirufa sp.]